MSLFATQLSPFSPGAPLQRGFNLPKLSCMSVDLSTAYCWPQVFDLYSDSQSDVPVWPQSCPVMTLAWYNLMTWTLGWPHLSLSTRLASQFRGALLSELAWWWGAGFPRDKLVLAEACHILPWMLFAELSWKNVGSSHTTIKQPLPQLKQSQAKTSPETTHGQADVKPSA